MKEDKLKFVKITFISDTHSMHKKVEKDLPGGDLLIHAGDVCGWSNKKEIYNFFEWFEAQNYTDKVVIAGNHDNPFEDYKELEAEVILKYDVDYLQDDLLLIGDDYKTGVKIWGSPWQPEFLNWAFNLPRNGEELKAKWDMIPIDVDILITHGPPQGILDISGAPWNKPNLGCELLRERIEIVKPKIHVFGHIHGSSGYMHMNTTNTHFINASVLNEQYKYVNKPFTIDWDKNTNSIKIL